MNTCTTMPMYQSAECPATMTNCKACVKCMVNKLTNHVQDDTGSIFRYVEQGDLYVITLYDPATDDYSIKGEYHTDKEAYGACVNLVNAGYPVHYIYASSYDFVSECEGGISFNNRMNFEEEILA